MQPKRVGVRLTAMVLAGFVSASASACGFVLTHGPPQGHEQMDYFACTESNVGPVLDAVWAGMSLGATIRCAAGDRSCESDDSYIGPEATAVILAVFFVAPWGSSAIVGFNKTKKCRAAIRQLRESQTLHGVPVRQESIETMVQSVVLTPGSDTLAVGEQLQLTASAYNPKGTILPNLMYVWSSSNDAIASVNGTGLVTAHATGAVVVAARTGDVVGTANLVIMSRR